MKVLVAGSTGAIGAPLVRALIDHRHTVFAVTHVADRAGRLRAEGAEPVVVDVLDAVAVDRVMADVGPAVVIDELTALPQRYSPDAMRGAAEMDTRVRMEGGGNLLRAAQRVGAHRYIVQSSGFWSAPGEALADEDTPLATESGAPGVRASARTYAALEARALGATGIETVVLRYGLFYGPGTWYTKDGDIAQEVRAARVPVVGNGVGVASFVHVEDAALATVEAISAPPGVYNIVDSQPSRLSVWLPAFARWVDGPRPPSIPVDEAARTLGLDYVYRALQLRGASNRKARLALGFSPRRLAWLPE